MNKQNPDLVGDDDDDYENNFCEMFNGLSKGLLVPVVNICNQAKNKSKIYSDILTLLKTTRELYLMKRETLNKNYMKTLEITLETTLEKKQRLDTIIEYAEFFNIYPTEKKDLDLFFKILYNSCIKDYILYTSQPIFEEPQDSDDEFNAEDFLGGKRRKRKSKKIKSKKDKNKKNKNKSKRNKINKKY